MILCFPVPNTGEGIVFWRLASYVSFVMRDRVFCPEETQLSVVVSPHEARNVSVSIDTIRRILSIKNRIK